MTDGQSLSLTIMAIALVVMAVVQVAAMVVVGLTAKRALEASERTQREIRPLLEKAHRIADDASKVTALTLKQVERVDQAITTTAARVDATLSVIEGSIVEPIRQGTALVTGLKAVMEVVRAWRYRDRRDPRDEEEGLFIG